jgi:glycosyltransferase involved in cell wall biosynthesis
MQRALDSLRPRFERFEILIINDYSRDATGAIADELAAKHPEIRVIHNPRNLGAGHSVWIGFRNARYNLVLHNAMDYPFDLADLDKLLPVLSQADIVVAARKSRPGYSPYRHLTSRVNLFLLRTLFDLKLHDYNFTQLYKKEVLDQVETETRSTAFITPETMFRAHDLGFRIKEVEIDYYPRLAGVATSGKLKVVLRSVQDLFRFWIRRKLGLGRPKPHVLRSAR